MKICVPIETDPGAASRICEHFGRAPFFAVADTETGRVEVQPNAGCSGDDDHHVRQLKAAGVEAVVCKGLGRRAFAALRDAGIDVLVSERDSVSGIVEDARGGRLESLPERRACDGGHGGQGGHSDHGGRGRHRHGAHGQGRGHRFDPGRGRLRSVEEEP